MTWQSTRQNFRRVGPLRGGIQVEKIVGVADVNRPMIMQFEVARWGGIGPARGGAVGPAVDAPRNQMILPFGKVVPKTRDRQANLTVKLVRRSSLASKPDAAVKERAARRQAEAIFSRTNFLCKKNRARETTSSRRKADIIHDVK